LKSLSRNLKSVLQKIKAAPHILLFLDYDGTLSPIVTDPAKAVLLPANRPMLKRLSKKPKITLSIVTGRPIHLIKRLVGLKDIYYAGNHGLEIGKGKKIIVVPEARKNVRLIREVKRLLVKKLKCIKGVVVEDKGVVLALHYRMVDKKRVPYIRKTFYEVLEPYMADNRLRAGKGKKVLEIRPPVEWDKGKYCRYLLGRLKKRYKGVVPIYIGDDITDEDAFKALGRSAITIFVRGEKKGSRAIYYVDSVYDVSDFLKILSNI